MDVLKAENLSMRYHRKLALEHLNLTLPEGKIVGLLGPNGSGKTTFIKLAAGLLTPTEGSITVCGQKIGPGTKALVSYLPDRTYFGRQIRVRQQLELFQDFYPDFDRARAEQMLAALGIGLEDSFKKLSKGTQEKVQLVLVMSRRARLYLLDEPIGGVDPAARDYILDTIIRNYNPEASVIISTHLIADVEKVLDEVVFIDRGQIFFQSSVDQIREEKGKSVDALFREVYRC